MMSPSIWSCRTTDQTTARSTWFARPPGIVCESRSIPKPPRARRQLEPVRLAGRYSVRGGIPPGRCDDHGSSVVAPEGSVVGRVNRTGGQAPRRSSTSARAPIPESVVGRGVARPFRSLIRPRRACGLDGCWQSAPLFGRSRFEVAPHAGAGASTRRIGTWWTWEFWLHLSRNWKLAWRSRPTVAIRWHPPAVRCSDFRGRHGRS